MTRTVTVPSAGARLATDIHLPQPGTTGRRKKHPTLLIRTPYGRSAHHAEARRWTEHGYAVAVQDVRGRHGSPGAWRPYAHEAADGAATLRWIRDRPWSDGRTVAAGSSYAAYCALVTVTGDTTHPPPHPDEAPGAVIAAVPALGTAETAREPSGVERLLGRAGWWAAHGDRHDSDPAALDRLLARDPGLLAHLPLTALPARLGRALPSWPGVWTTRWAGPVLGLAAAARVPLLAIGGTHDPFAADTVALWRHWGGPARLVLGPWGHRLTRDPGPGARPEHHIDTGRLAARWARAVHDGRFTDRTEDTGRTDGAHRAHGAIALAGSPWWCPAGPALDTPAHHCPFEPAEPPHTSGDLGPAPPDGPPPGRPLAARLLYGATFLADPAHPVRSDDLRADPDRADRALLLTAPLDHPVDLLGTASALLRARADTPAADWFVRVVALDPEGRAAPLALGTARTAGPPGSDTTVRVELGLLARRLPAGTRLRIEVAGHHFPAHARNPHTGGDPVTATRLLPSRRTLHPDGSALLLPVTEVRRADTVRPDPAEETHP
nr:CocE/NonD family hydrolase [Streptomyces sp. YSPA8]